MEEIIPVLQVVIPILTLLLLSWFKSFLPLNLLGVSMTSFQFLTSGLEETYTKDQVRTSSV